MSEVRRLGAIGDVDELARGRERGAAEGDDQREEGDGEGRAGTAEAAHGPTLIRRPSADNRSAGAGLAIPVAVGPEPGAQPPDLVGLDHAVDQAVLLRLLGGEVAVAVHVVVDPLDRLAGVAGGDLVHAPAPPPGVAGGGLPVPPPAPGGAPRAGGGG